MSNVTEAELADLLKCPKQVVDPPKREMRLDGKI
jgi:hypothetical protein